MVDYTDFYPSGVTAVAIASTLICSTWTDHTQVRWPVLVYMSVACIIASICILVWSSPTGLKFFAYCEFLDFPEDVCLSTHLILAKILQEPRSLAKRLHLRWCFQYEV